ncbi:MAG: pyridoxamine 5'-phosphate oxidase family protein [Syntrophaceae bacterium]|nr:pyridoxamine 5'-phosphate oxidase family protein [Syntrophaceae bacterium]
MTTNNEQKISIPKSSSATDQWSFKLQSKTDEFDIPGSFGATYHSHIKQASELFNILDDLFRNQNLAVLCTQKDGAPYGNLVAFACAENLTKLIFVTPRATRKFSNMLSEPRVAMVIDNRSNDRLDFSKAIAVTATGRVTDSSSTQRQRLLDIYLSKHPHLKEFAQSPSCAVICIDVDTYYCVYRFQNVMELHLRQ